MILIEQPHIVTISQDGDVTVKFLALAAGRIEA